ncbi:MAG: class B sortase [Clostridia bacterium]|nr:class B sortase [Clostridia bacterium]
MKKLFIVLMCICILLIGVVIALKIGYNRTIEKGEDEFESALDSLKVFTTDKPQTPMDSITAPADTTVSDTEPEETQPVTATLDFSALADINPDIYAWIEIEGTKVDYPVLQSPDNDDKYLNTAYDGSRYIGGAIFTQAGYNSNDFNDPVTLIYGHTMASGTLFGQLQKVYSSADGFASHGEIKIYLPDGTRYYDVFAAVPFENLHIMHNYDFTSEYWYENFFDRVFDVRSFGANFNEELRPQYGDRVIILSTCLNEDSSKRFLVMAVNRDDIADNPAASDG